jgi:hypothetical protein
MSTIAVPSTIGRWPRAAVAAVVALVVALALTISLAFALGRHTTTRTFVRLAPALDQPLVCRVGHAC